MRLPNTADQALREAFRQIEAADRQNLKSDRDLEIGQNRLILTSPNGSRYAVTVSNAGILSATPI